MRPDTGVDDSLSGGAACALSEVVEQVSGKWSIGILLAASHGPVRFTQFERRIRGISRRMLTRTLRGLERDGLLVRTVHPTVPVTVEYSLSPIGIELCSSLVVLTGWAERHHDTIAEARRVYDEGGAAPGETA